MPPKPKPKKMDEKKARKVLQEAQKRIERKRNLDPDKILFAHQKKFVLDESKSKIALCSRRAGKSFSEAFILLDSAFKHERSLNPFITLTRDNARNILWPALHSLNEQFRLKLQFKENTGDVVLPNGSRIILRGADDKRQIEKLRGPKYPVAVIDEAQGFPWFLKDLIEDVLEPATLDYNGPIIISGTPNSACAGPFWAMSTGQAGWEGWSVHRWTLRDNPFLPDVAGWLERKKAQKGWGEDHPTYLREYCGKWIRDSNTLVFKFQEDVNLVEEFSEEAADDWEYVLGIDLGFNDPTAFVVLAYSHNLGQSFVVESYKESGLIPSVAADRVGELLQMYPFSRIVADTGGFGKGYAEEFKVRFSLPVLAAQKLNKVTYIEMMNGDLWNGKLQVCRTGNRDLLDEIRLLQWDENRLSRGKFVYDRNFADHLTDALLYAWRECRHHDYDPVEEGPVPGTDDFWRKKADEHEQALAEKIEAQNSKSWWEL